MEDGSEFGLVPLQGSYVAKRCPVVVQLQYDDSLEVEAVPLTEPEQARADAGIAFEQVIFSAILDLHTTATAVVDGGARTNRQEATLSAMVSGPSIVLGGWLPDDPAGRRTGQPDVLVRLDDGWAPIDVKHHGVLIGAAEWFGAVFGADRAGS